MTTTVNKPRRCRASSLETRISAALARSAGKKKVELVVASFSELFAAEALLKDRPGGDLVAVVVGVTL
jgi:hypothetical protein